MRIKMLFCFTNNKCQIAYIRVNVVLFFNKIYIYTNRVESSTSRKIEIKINSCIHTHTHKQRAKNKLNRSIHTFVYMNDVQLNWKNKAQKIDISCLRQKKGKPNERERKTNCLRWLCKKTYVHVMHEK